VRGKIGAQGVELLDIDFHGWSVERSSLQCQQ